MSPHARLADLNLHLERSSAMSLPLQIVQGIRQLVRAGVLKPGDRLPSRRDLAQQLEVSRGSIDTAFDHLKSEGVVLAKARSGMIITPDLPRGLQSLPPAHAQGALGHMQGPPTRAQAAPARPVPEMIAGSAPRETSQMTPGGTSQSAQSQSAHSLPAQSARIDLRPGAGYGDPRTDPVFRSAMRRALDAGPPDTAAGGGRRLREAIAEHLRLVRGMPVEADEVIVTGGSRDGVLLSLDALGHRRIGVEDPGFPGLRTALAGRELLHLPIDANGLLVPDLAPPPPAVLVTPNHVFPTGSSMPASRRRALLNWAGARQVMLFEDDYDSEARYAGALAPTLYDLAAGEGIVHLGTFSTVLTSALGTGYLLARGDTRAALLARRAALGPAVAPLFQDAVAAYLAAGGLRKRLHRARSRLQQAEPIVAQFAAAGAELAHETPWLPGPTIDTGRSIVVQTPADIAHAVRAQAAQAGVLLADLGAGWTAADPQAGRRSGLVIARATVTTAALESALDQVLALLRAEYQRHKK